MTNAPVQPGADSGREALQDLRRAAFGKRTSQQMATVLVAWFALILMAAYVLWQAATNPSLMSDPWADLAYASLLVLFAVAAYGATRLKPFAIRDGLVTLPWPIPDATGRRRRSIALEEIQSVAPARSERNETGVLVSLKDGTTLHLWDPDLPQGASEYLLSIGRNRTRVSRSVEKA